MRRLVVAALLIPVIAVEVRKAANKAAPAMRARCSTSCERMLANMPETFPPNRILTDLEALRAENARVLSLVERQAAEHA